MKRFATIIFTFGIIVSVCNCGLNDDRAKAETIASHVFESIKVADMDNAITFYSPEFFRRTSREEWRSILLNLNRKLGALQSYELRTWNLKKEVNSSGSGTYWALQYQVQYSKYPATETLTIFKPISGGQYRIVGHNIDSVGLLKG